VNIAGLILAGGASKRMGSPKALLPLGEETFLDRLIGVFQPVCGSVTVVLGHEPEKIQDGLKRAAAASFVVNPDYERGQLSSLQTGLREVPAESSAVLFTPVDYPMVQAETLAALADGFRENRVLLAVPRHAGKHGHPVLFSSALIAEFLRLPDGAAARDVIHEHRERTLYVDVDDEGVVGDVDSPSDYEDLLRRREERGL
jgi:molybdenum cofactor cytidylyltransferase